MPTAASDFVGHGRDDGIELLRAVQRDGGDRLGRRLEQCLEFGCRHDPTGTGASSCVRARFVAPGFPSDVATNRQRAVADPIAQVVPATRAGQARRPERR